MLEEVADSKDDRDTPDNERSYVVAALVGVLQAHGRFGLLPLCFAGFDLAGRAPPFDPVVLLLQLLGSSGAHEEMISAGYLPVYDMESL